jgi:predicted Zn-dependent protease
MATPATNRVRFLVVMTVLVVGAGVAFGGYRYLLKRRVQHWRQWGISAAQEKDYPSASQFLGQYLQRNPRDVEALNLYIQAREAAELPNAQHLAQTIAALKMLLTIEPDRLDARKHLLELLLRLDARPEALDAASAILTRDPKDVRALAVKTEVLKRQHQDREALAAAEKWTQAAPNSFEAQMARIALRATLGHPPEEIIAEAKKLHEAHTGDPTFELILGFAYSRTGDDEQAAQWFKTAASHQGLPDDFTEALVAQFDAVGMSNESMLILTERVKAGAGVKIRHDLARRHWEQGKWEQTLALLNDLDASDPAADATLVAFRTMALGNLGRLKEAQEATAALAARKQAAARAWAMLLDQIINNAAVDQRNLIAECRNALSIDPDNRYLRYYLGDAYSRLSETDQAIQQWRTATAQDATWAMPPVRLVESLLQQGRPEQAMDVAAYVVRRNPNSAAAIVSLARAWAADLETGGIGRADDLLKLVTEIQKQLPAENRDRIAIIELQLMAQKGNKSIAVQHAREILARTTPAPNEQLILNIASLSLRYDLGVEEECYARSEQLHGVTPSLAYSRAIARAVGGQSDDGLKRFDELAKRSGHESDVKWRLARARYLDITLSPAAKAAWIELGDSFPKDLSVQKGVLQARAVAGDWDFMQRAIKRVSDLTGPNVFEWRTAEAKLLVDYARNADDVQQGSIKLQELIRQFPDQTEPRVLLAHALVQMKRYDGAIEQLTVASKLDPTSVPIALQLAGLLQSRGDFDRVRQQLDRVLPRIRTPDQRREAAALLAKQGDTDQAMSMLSTTQPSGPQYAFDQQDDLLLAILYRRQHQLAKAEAMAKKLLEKPDVPSIQFAASLYLSEGREAEAQAALALLDKVNTKLEPGMKELVLGSYYAEAQDLPKAIAHYETATKQAPTNSSAWRVLAACRIVNGQPDEAIKTLDVARQALPNDNSLTALKPHTALIRDAAPNPDLRPLVVTLIREPLYNDGVVELLRIMVDAQASTDLERVAGKLQQLIERNPDLLPARLCLAQCFQTMGRPTNALSTLRQAMAVFPADPAPPRAAAGIYAAIGQWQELAGAAVAWRKRTNDERVAADTALACAQIGLQQYDAALQDLEPYVSAAKEHPERFGDVLTNYATALARSGRLESAAQLVQPNLAKSEAWRSIAMRISFGIPQKTDALNWMQKIAEAIPKDALAEQVALAETYDFLGQRLNDPALREKAWNDLKQIGDGAKTAPVLMMAKAAQAERSGDLQSAEALYRKTIAADPTLWVAHNNLAMLILKRNGDVKEALQLAQAAAKLQPRVAAVHDTLARAESKAGDSQSAAKVMQSAIQLEPDKTEWRVMLAQYQLDSGNRIEAGKTLDGIDAAKLDVQGLSDPLRRQMEAIRKSVKDQAKPVAVNGMGSVTP